MAPEWLEWLKLLLPVVVTIQIYQAGERRKMHRENGDRLDSIDNRMREANGHVREHAVQIERNTKDIEGLLEREREGWDDSDRRKNPRYRVE